MMRRIDGFDLLKINRFLNCNYNLKDSENFIEVLISSERRKYYGN